VSPDDRRLERCVPDQQPTLGAGAVGGAGVAVTQASREEENDHNKLSGANLVTSVAHRHVIWKRKSKRMDNLLPYVGLGFLIVVAAVAVIALAKHGVWLRRVKHRDTEVEFDSLCNTNTTSEGIASGITQESVCISEDARNDIHALSV